MQYSDQGHLACGCRVPTIHPRTVPTPIGQRSDSGPCASGGQTRGPTCTTLAHAAVARDAARVEGPSGDALPPSRGCEHLCRDSRDGRKGRAGGVHAEPRHTPAYVSDCSRQVRRGRRFRGSSNSTASAGDGHALACTRKRSWAAFVWGERRDLWALTAESASSSRASRASCTHISTSPAGPTSPRSRGRRSRMNPETHQLGVRR
jgi:hypothetical protein